MASSAAGLLASGAVRVVESMGGWVRLGARFPSATTPGPPAVSNTSCTCQYQSVEKVPKLVISPLMARCFQITASKNHQFTKMLHFNISWRFCGAN